MSKLTQEQVRELFSYNQETGILRWENPRCRGVKRGREAGCIDNSNGYRQVYVRNKPYYTHRIVWLFVYGYFPEHQVDHINRDRLDNRIKNLREVSQSCNNRNIGLRNNNKTGVTGVSWDATRARWEVKISVNGKQRSVGRYKHFSNAVCARLMAEQCLNWSSCNQSSAAFKYVNENIQGELK